MSSRLDADVVVVGAGPAGTAAAIWCARHGLRTLILERHGPGRSRARPGESLHPGVEPVLERLGVGRELSAAGCERHAGHWVKWNRDAVFQPFGSDESGPWLGFQAPGPVLDTILLDQARASGAELKRPCAPLDVLTVDNRVAGVITEEGPIKSRFVVDASGRRHWLAGRLGLAIERRSPRLIARYGYVEGSCPELDGAPRLTADDRGWTWTAKVGPATYHWSRLWLNGMTPRDAGPPAELSGLRAAGSARSADMTWRVVPASAGYGYFVVGDAASVLDPASSHGVLKAVMSGMQAAHLVVAADSAACSQARAATQYRRWAMCWFEHDVAGLQELYRQLPQPPGWVADGAGRDLTPLTGPAAPLG